jgi:DNA-binding MarR family transcriptional regulator
MNTKIKRSMNTLNRINRKLFTSNESNEESLIGIGQINILKEIIDNKNINQDTLASNLNLDKTTIAKAVKRLESKDLITRKRSEHDRRKNELVATKKALIVEEKMREHIEQYSQSFFEGISEEEIDRFEITLEKIENNIERNRTMKNDKKDKIMKMLCAIEENENVDIKKLSSLLDKDEEKIKKRVKKMMDRDLVEERDGYLYVISRSKEHGMDSKKKEDHGKSKAKKEVLKAIMKNSGLSKEDLKQHTDLEEQELDSLLAHFESKGILEIRDDKLFADRDAVKHIRKHK